MAWFTRAKPNGTGSHALYCCWRVLTCGLTTQGFTLANNTQDSMYQVIGSDPVRAKRFADTMAAFTSGKGFDLSHIIDNYNWSEVADGLLVDVGGAGGHSAISLAKHFESLHVVVQDLEGSMAGAAVPEQLAARVRFMAHDFFTPQPVTADVYYFRWIFHNWPDKYCIQILRCLIPALKDGARVVIHDICMPEPGMMAHWREKQMRYGFNGCKFPPLKSPLTVNDTVEWI